MGRFISWLENRDDQILHFVHCRVRSPLLDRWMAKVTHLGGATFTISLLLILAISSSIGYHTLGYHMGIEGLISLTLSHIMVQILKKSCNRKRPYYNVKIEAFAKQLKDYSFPSGHTTAIFSLCTTIILFIPLLASVLYPLAGIVGFSRVYLGHHYPTDVVVGALLGTIFGLGVHFF